MDKSGVKRPSGYPSGQRWLPIVYKINSLEEIRPQLEELKDDLSDPQRMDIASKANQLLSDEQIYYGQVQLKAIPKMQNG